MCPYEIYINGNLITTIHGTEAAYESFKLVGLGLYGKAQVDLVDGLTGEILANNEEDL